MRSPTGKGSRALISCLLPLLFTGCAGVDPLVVKEREAEELRYQTERMRESISQLLGTHEDLREQLRSGEAEVAQVERQRTEAAEALGEAREQITALTAERLRLQGDLRTSEDLRKEFQSSLKRVQSVASSSAGELTDLRVKSRELEERVARLTSDRDVLGKENTRMSDELEKVQAELVRTRAVARSLQQGKETDTVAATFAKQLELERANLQGENVALQKRIDQLEKKAAEGREEVVREVAATGPFYQNDPQGLFDELKLLGVSRYESALEGRVAWDAFDIAVVSVVGVLLLVFFLFVLRLGHTGQLKKEVRNLRISLQELDEAAVTMETEEVGSRPTAPVPPGARGVRKPPRRHAGFSAVISNTEEVRPSGTIERGPVVEAVAEGPGGGTDADVFERVLDNSAQEGNDPAVGRAASRKVIGAGVWTDQPTVVDPTPTVVSPVGATDDDEEAMAHTQIMPSFTEVELQGTRLSDSLKPVAQTGSKNADPDAGDKEILSELKTVINRKFDELLK